MPELKRGFEFQYLMQWITNLTQGRSVILTAFTIAIVLLPVVVIVWGSQLASQRTLDYFSSQMTEKAELAASLIDPVALRRLQNAADTDNAAYRRLIEPLVVFFQTRQDVRCVHSFRQAKTNRLEYVLDVTTQLDRLGIPRVLEPSRIGDPFELEPAIADAIIDRAGAGETMVFNKPINDQFGTFIGACSPIPGDEVDDQQIVCVDFLLDGIERQLEEIGRLRNLALILSLLLSGTLGLILWHDRRALALANARLQKLAQTDSLTGLYNRRRFQQAMQDEIARVKRYRKVAALLLLDVDHFKQINDSFGHAAGDAVLTALADLLMKKIRPVDLCGRLGGEEFAILLPESDLQQARHLADRLRRDIAGMDVTPTDGVRIKFTVSIGIAEFDVASENLHEVFKTADERLYRAKAEGRNRVFCG